MTPFVGRVRVRAEGLPSDARVAVLPASVDGVADDAAAVWQGVPYETTMRVGAAVVLVRRGTDAPTRIPILVERDQTVEVSAGASVMAATWAGKAVRVAAVAVVGVAGLAGLAWGVRYVTERYARDRNETD